MRKRKAADNKPWILGNNPDEGHKCGCFKNKLPDTSWVMVNTFAQEEDCAKFLNDCQSFFKKKPLASPRRRMGMMG